MKNMQNSINPTLTLALILFAAGAGTCPAATNAFPGLVLHFNMDEVRADAFTDLVTSNALGRVTNARTTSNGKLASACEFSGKSSFVQVADSPALNPKQLTLALWFRCAKDAWVTRTLLEKGTERGYALSIAGGSKESARRGKLRATVNGRDCLSDAAVNDDAWHHAAATFDGETLKLYVDGALQKQTATSKGDLAANAFDLTLGMNRSSPSAQEKDHALDGLLDEVMLFDRSLGEADIKRLLSAVKPKFTKQQVARRIAELKELYDRGLLRKDFYDRKMEECEVVE